VIVLFNYKVLCCTL